MQLVNACLCIIVCASGISSETDDTFLVSFQSEGARSTTQWMKYKTEIAILDKEFSTCHWEKLKYFSIEINSIWAYCFIFSASDKLGNKNCIQLTNKCCSLFSYKI